MTAARVNIADHAAPGGPALAVRGLTRSFGAVRALRGVDFSLDSGEVLAVFGPNGAGKTTLLRIVAGLLRPEQGEVIVGAEPLARGDARHRRLIGMISHHSLLYDGLTARENLEFYGRLYGVGGTRAAALRALAAVGLEERATSLVATMSRGMIQRLAIARALLHEPEIVLLDEPFTGLDQQAAATLRGLLGRLRDDRRTVVLVTHNLDEGLELATHVAILVAGRFVECGPKRGDIASYRARYAQATSAGA
ncbi:MAG: heme ABC exporter ATP-binding protein CcmA [Gemmatimonadetes bacterium]|nr:heme ABC exporter ATP-binding protein CcmA [Gemmatimonadota bacterium]